ncbi:MAG TPA: HAMP domain-containing sensor histidine kinase, partial [Elusimicrobiota bacterium]|nr:HAMP domain-containing sensor histidine kinase [Elusimicrobiota bacterium]
LFMKLSHWLPLIFALFGAVIAGGLVARHVEESRREAYAQAERLGSVTLEAVRALVQAQGRQGRYIELGRNFADLVRQADVATIVVRDRKGRRLVGRSDDVSLLAREPKPGRPIAAVDDGFYDVEGPVDLGPRGKGTVTVSFRTARLENRLRDVAVGGVGAGVTAFLTLALSAWFIGMFAGERIERVIGRIESLSAAPEKFRPLRSDALGGTEVSRLVDAFNRMGATLKAETARRRELEAEKRELSAMLVHDLKTPLTVIRSGIALLGEVAPVSGGKREHERTFELLELSTARLQRMVEDVLQLAKLEESASPQKTDVVDLKALATGCAKDFGLIVADRKQRLELSLAGEVPPVLGDGALLRRVFDNLVHNAVEHTPPGGLIRLGVRPEDGGAVVEVCDSGPGVPLEARADVFRKFFQKDVKRHVGNVGLGLALCEKVVLRHGGSIGIGDASPKGARFYFTLPAAPSPEDV